MRIGREGYEKGIRRRDGRTSVTRIQLSSYRVSGEKRVGQSILQAPLVIQISA